MIAPKLSRRCVVSTTRRSPDVASSAEATAGPGRLALVDANDSRDACGSLRDRHETIGVGTLGEAAFAELLTHPSTDGVPVIVETPSTGYAGHAADIATLARLSRRPHQRKRGRVTPLTRS